MNMLGAALWYAQRGHPVFPLKPGTKIPGTKRGFKDASTDPDLIRQWWQSNPKHNIGLPTGLAFDVIDIDGPAGLISIAEIEDTGKLPTILGYASTPRGYHLYINPTGDGCTTSILDGIDYRGRGGYVVAPPSVSDTGTWRWIEPPTFATPGLETTDD